LRPAKVIYGTFLEEFNGKFLLHVAAKDTMHLEYRDKNIMNALWHGPSSLSSILDPSNFHIYVFALNNAFRNVQNPNALQRLSFGVNMYMRDSSYEFEPAYFTDLKEIYSLCKKRHIPFALFNAPVRSKVESYADLPYLHKSEAYTNLQHFAEDEHIPLWNFDGNEKFTDDDFLDTYHLNARGTHKLTELIGQRFDKWNKGFVEQDIVDSSANPAQIKVQNSLIRTVFHF